MPHDTHHFVPAFLLRQWEGGTDHKLSAFHWVQAKLRHDRYKAKSVAKAAGLYSLKEGNGSRNNLIEREFFTREIDEPAAQVHRRILDSGITSLDPNERVSWGRFIVAQMLRVPRMLTSLKSKGARTFLSAIETNPAEYDQAKGDSDPSTLSEWIAQNLPLANTDDLSLAALPSIVDSDLLHDVMRKAHWGTIEPQNAPTDFLIGDHPLIYVGTMDSSFLLALPISPRVAFLAFNQRQTAERIRARRGGVFIDGLNVATVRTAEQYVYAADAQQYALVAAHLRKPPPASHDRAGSS